MGCYVSVMTAGSWTVLRRTSWLPHVSDATGEGEAWESPGRAAPEHEAASALRVDEHHGAAPGARHGPEGGRGAAEEAADDPCALGDLGAQHDQVRHHGVLRGWPTEADQGHDEAHRPHHVEQHHISRDIRRACAS